MKELRASPPQSLADLAVEQVRDYLSLTVTDSKGSSQPLAAPRGDMVILDLAAQGHFVAIRPSGTEPKVKFYLFSYVAPEQLHLLDEAGRELDERLDGLERDLRALAD
jgi:phosphoglucomutase/phosphomannomutase